jgi:hypothetical protein
MPVILYLLRQCHFDDEPDAMNHGAIFTSKEEAEKAVDVLESIDDGVSAWIIDEIPVMGSHTEYVDIVRGDSDKGPTFTYKSEDIPTRMMLYRDIEDDPDVADELERINRGEQS